MRGPYLSSSGDTRKSQGSRRWFRTDIGQKVRTPLPFESTQSLVLQGPTALLKPWTDLKGNLRSPCPVAGLAFGYWTTTGVWNRMNERLNKAVRKFQEKAGQKIQLGTDYAERKKTFSQVSGLLQGMKNPAATLAAVASRYCDRKKIKRSDPGRWNIPLSEIVNPKYIPGSTREVESVLRTLSKDAGNAWLAWHFGIKPLANEISTALQLWQDERPKKQLITTSCRGDYQQLPVNDPVGSSGYRDLVDYRGWGRCAGTVEEVNSFTVTLDQLGLLNPFSTALELMPFSFIWGSWLYPLDLYVNSMFGFMPGYRIVNGYQTIYLKGKHQITYQGGPAIDPYYGQTFDVRTHAVRRTLGVSPVFQKTINPWSTSRERFLTTSALLLKVFKF